MKSKFVAVPAAVAVLGVIAVTPAYSVNCDAASQAQKQICCSARDCGGKVLSNRDRHNCFDKSHGHSWHGTDGVCYNTRGD